MSLESILEELVAGRITVGEALRALAVGGSASPSGWAERDDALSGAPLESAAPSSGSVARPVDLRPDLERRERTGIPEVVLAERKSAEETVRALRFLASKGRGALATRVPLDRHELLLEEFPHGRWHERARVFELEDPKKERLPGTIAVVSAGTSDAPVAEEAAITAEFLGSPVERTYDVGVAGIHRLFERQHVLTEAAALVVVAGMEGALASVVGGLVSGSVIAVPTSVGYGASFGGIAALLAMLNSCAPGVVVVNIDNGFGAAVAAHRIHRAAAEGARG